MAFAEKRKRAALAMLRHHGEDVTYHTDGGTSKTVRARVERRGLTADERLGAATLSTTDVFIPMTEIESMPGAGDYLELSLLPGQPVERVRVAELLGVDGDFWVVRLEA